MQGENERSSGLLIVDTDQSTLSIDVTPIDTDEGTYPKTGQESPEVDATKLFAGFSEKDLSELLPTHETDRLVGDAEHLNDSKGVPLREECLTSAPMSERPQVSQGRIDPVASSGRQGLPIPTPGLQERLNELKEVKIRYVTPNWVSHDKHDTLFCRDQGAGDGRGSHVGGAERDEQIEKSGEVFWSVHGTLRFMGTTFSLRDRHIVTTSKQLGIEETDYI